MSPPADHRSRAGRRSLELGLPAAVALGVVAFYVVLYPIHGYRVPIGSDTPVYIWWTRLAGASGLGPLETGARPGIVALLATLARVTGMTDETAAGAAAPPLAAAVALAAAAFAGRATLSSRPRRRFLLVGLFTGAFLVFLVPGYLSTLGFGALWLAALAAAAEGFHRPTWRPVVAGGVLAVTGGPGGAARALVAGAGLQRPLFLAVGAGIAAGGAVALVPSWRTDRANGIRPVGTSLGRLAVAGTVGVPIIGAGLLASLAPASVVVDTSRDAVIRRLSLPSLLRSSYLRKLRHDFPWWRAATVVGLALSPFAAPAGAFDQAAAGPAERDRARLFRGAMAGWLVLTSGAIVALALGASAPGQRLADLCLPLPILAGLGVAAFRPRSRAVNAGAVLVAAVLFLTVAWLGWGGDRPLVTDAQVDQARSAGALLASKAPGTQLVMVMENLGDRPALWVTRYANYLRDGVPAARAGDVHVVLDTIDGFVAGRPSSTGLAEHDRLARDSLGAVQALPTDQVEAVVLASIDPQGYREASAIPGARLVAAGVVAIPGFDAAPPAGSPPGGRAPPAATTEPGAGPRPPWEPAWAATALLGLFVAAGWPWARLALPWTPPAVRLSLAPAFGIAALSLASVAADAAGLRLSAAGGFAALAVALAGWPVLALPRRVRASASGPTPDSSPGPAAGPAATAPA